MELLEVKDIDYENIKAAVMLGIIEHKEGAVLIDAIRRREWEQICLILNKKIGN